MSNSKTSVSKAQNDEHKRVLTLLLKQDDNRRCADCQARGPTWASVNLGIFVCLNCSGIHRSMGVHLSKVRSVNLDTWLPDQVAFVAAMGNGRAGVFWEARLPSGFERPRDGDMRALSTFINSKYKDRAFVMTQWPGIPTIETYQQHPFLAALEAGELDEEIAGGASNDASSTGSRSRPGSRSTSPPLQPAGFVVAASPAKGPVTPAKQRMPPPAPRPPAAAPKTAPPAPRPRPTEQLFDLMSLNAHPAAATPTAAQPPAPIAFNRGSGLGSDGEDWDAFVAASQGNTPPAGAAAAASNDAGLWAEFESGGAAISPRSASASSAQARGGPVSDDPFAPPPVRPGHARSLSAPSQRPSQQPPVIATASQPQQPATRPPLPAAPQQQQSLRSQPSSSSGVDPFAVDPFAVSSYAAAGPDSNGSMGGSMHRQTSLPQRQTSLPQQQPQQQSTSQAPPEDPFAPRRGTGLSGAMAAARLAATPPAKLLGAKKTPDDILKLFNAQPANALFAGSPAQDLFFNPGSSSGVSAGPASMPPPPLHGNGYGSVPMPLQPSFSGPLAGGPVNVGPMPPAAVGDMAPPLGPAGFGPPVSSGLQGGIGMQPYGTGFTL